MHDFLHLKRTKNKTVCLVLYKWAVRKTVCVTRKMAGVGHLALYWARSSLRAAQSGWCRDCPGTQHSCDPAWNPGRAGNCLQRTLGPLWLDLFFQHKIYIFFLFFKNVFNKKCQKCRDCIPIYSMKMLKFFHIKSHYCTLHFMYDISTYIRGEAHIQLYVQLICTVPNIQFVLVLLRCKKSRNLFSIFIIFST